MNDATKHPVVLFGAFDRHNFGDLLFPHIAQALLGRRNVLTAGLAARDMRMHGGHRLASLAQLAASLRKQAPHIIHAGGELLTCDAWQAAAMLLPPHEARSIITQLDQRPEQALAWAQRELGLTERAPYLLSPELFPHVASVRYNAVGGVDLDRIDPAMRAEVWTKLKAADRVSVRDRQTKTLLDAAGIVSLLIPDPAVMVAELFGTAIGEHAKKREVARILSDCPYGYLAVQFSADFGDDETLAEMAAQLDRAAAASGYGIAFFRAGAAPWHDDLHTYRRTISHMSTPALLFESLHLWDICALIANSRGYAGSSLHGRIIAMVFALPRINLLHPAQAGQPTKQAAFAATWEEHGMPATAEVRDIAEGIAAALAADRGKLRRTALDLAAQYRAGFKALCAGLE